jgi:plastocyanin
MKVTGSLVVCCVAALVGVGALVVGAGGAAPASPAAPTNGPVGQLDIQEFAYSNLHVTPGETVLVANHDSVAHTVTADDGAFDSGNVPGGKAVRFVAPDRPDTYEFICTIHPSMRGQLVVR